MANILIIDDNHEILDANLSHLAGEGFHVTATDTGVKAIAYLNEKQYDCIVLDILMPDLDGFAICKAARTVTDAPIIFLSCMDDPDDKVRGLMAGGDDYMTKPYSLKELAARVRALLRRAERSAEPKAPAFYLDRRNRRIHAKELSVYLSQQEFVLFLLLYENPGTVFSKKELLEKVWQNPDTDIRTVAVHILKLRRKLDYAADVIGRIENGYGEGYFLSPPKTEA